MLAVVMFGLSAVGGLVFATKHLKGQPPSIGVGLIHGLLGATGLLSLIWYVMHNAVVPRLNWSLGLFVVVALGGFGLFGAKLMKKPIPRPLLVIHALGAVTAYLLLLSVAFF